jgi:hypothetical protein
MDQPRADYDEPDPPTWPGFVTALLLPFVVVTAFVGVGIAAGFLIFVSVTR